MKHLKKLKLWVQDHALFNTNTLGALLICIGYLIMNSIKYINEVTATNLFFLFLAIGLTLIAFEKRNNHWFYKTFFEVCCYNILDELLGNACKTSVFEITGAVLLIFYNWKTWKYS